MNNNALLITLIISLSFCANVKEQNSGHTENSQHEFPDSILAGQLIMVAGGQLGRPDAEIASLVSKGKIGGVIFLKTSQPSLIKSKNLFDSIASSKSLPRLIYATDAEPGMFANKILGVNPTPYNNQLQSEFETRAAAVSISEDLYALGLTWNFAPVCDIADQNSIIGKRSFGNDPNLVGSMAWAFSKESQKKGVAATAKHFPGHGKISGDTHNDLFNIDGPFLELAPFKVLIDSGIEAVMVGHIGVKNNPFSSENLPASCSKRIITDLLIDSLGFNGIIVTDAMNMGAIMKIQNPEILSIKAGAHVILMPMLPSQLHRDILKLMKSDKKFDLKVKNSASKILGLKMRFPHI